ncbi:MAG: OmpH family outer membrane protein [Nitrospinae bacterium]|nr:OmpH family outer membrane protein [Nitrospinota bacterium]
MRTIMAALFCAAAVLATPKISAADSKIGGVNIQKVLDDSEAGKKALTELKDRADKEKDHLEKKLDAIKKLEKDIESQKMVAKEGAIVEKEQELKKLKRELDAFREDTSQTLQKAQGQTMRKLITDVRRIIKDYAKKNGYTLIVEKGDDAAMVSGFVMYLDESADITGAVIKAYDEETRQGKKK